MVGALVTAAGIHSQGFSLMWMTTGLCFIGTSMGIIAANAPFIVTSGLQDKEARQSGGIQAAARDIGQALGVALVSMVMLTTLTLSMKNQSQHTELSVQTRDRIQQMTVIPYMGDTDFTEQLIKAGVSKNEQPVLMQSYQRARARVTKAGLFSMVLMTMLFLSGTKNVPVSMSDDKQ